MSARSSSGCGTRTPCCGAALVDPEADRVEDPVAVFADRLAEPNERFQSLACRANGTPSTLTPCSGHSSRRSWAWSSRRQTPRSKCRQTDSTCCRLWRCGVEKPHSGQQRAPAPKRQVDRDPVLVEADTANPDPVQAQQPRESRVDAHRRPPVELLDLRQPAACRARAAARVTHSRPAAQTSSVPSFAGIHAGERPPLADTPLRHKHGRNGYSFLSPQSDHERLLQADSQQPANLHPCREPHKYIGTAHLPLGHYHDPEDDAGKTLITLGLTCNDAKRGLVEALGKHRAAG